MHRLSGTNTQHHAQNLRIPNTLSQLRVEARAVDLNKRKMKPGGKCDRFDQVRVCRVGISSRNCCTASLHSESGPLARNLRRQDLGLRRQFGRGPKTGVYCELGEVRKPLLHGRSGSHTAWQRAEMRAKKAIATVEVCGVGTFGL